MYNVHTHIITQTYMYIHVIAGISTHVTYMYMPQYSIYFKKLG